MIFGKMWAAIRAQFNKLANFFWTADPIAQMQYEYDSAVEEMKEGRKGLEIYRGLVERVARQVSTGKAHVDKLTAQAKAFLKIGDRDSAAKFALELQKAKGELKENEDQLALHEKSYENNLKKIQHANGKLVQVREKIKRYDAELKMSEAEAEVAKLSESFDVNVTTDFGQIEQVIQDRIDRNRGRVRVAADMSSQGIADIEAQERLDQAMAQQALSELESELGMTAPETTPITETQKHLGPASERDKA